MTRKLTTIVALALLVACKDKAAEEAAAKSEAAAAGATAAAAAAALVPAFTDAAKNADKLIPAAATLVGSIDVAGLTKTGLYETNKGMLQDAMSEVLVAADACSVGLAKLERITFGVDPESNSAALVVDAVGIGKPDTLACLNKKITEKEGREPWTVEDRDGKKVLVMRDGVGHMVSDNRLAIASGQWVGAMKELVDGKAKSAFDGELKEVIARADTTKVIWAAGKMPAAAVKGTPADGAKDLTASLDLSSGLAFAGSIGFGSADEAKLRAADLQKQFDGLKGMATGMGVPQGVVDSVKISNDEKSLVLAVTMTAADLTTLQANVLKSLGG